MPFKATPEAPRTQARIGPIEAAAVAVGSFVLLIVGWVVLHSDLYGFELTDIGLYQRYGEAILDGRVPYRDFGVGYPPAALPVFVLPALGASEDYRGIFEFLMLVCAEAAIGFVVLTLRAIGAARLRVYAAAVFVGLAPLALGPVVISRYDYWPAALTAAGLAALVAHRAHLGVGLLAVAVAAKFYAVALLPLALVYVWRREGPRRALVALGLFVAVLAVIALPFVLGGNFEKTAEGQTIRRALQIESLGSATLLAADRLGAYSATVVANPGSQGLAGPFADHVGTATTVVQLVAVFAVWILFLRGPPTVERLLVASAAAVAGFVAFGKVFSPQYLIWLIPLVPLVGRKLGLIAAGLLAAVLVLTEVWFPERYFELLAVTDIIWVVLARDLVVVALYATLAVGLARRPAARAEATIL